MLAPLVVVEMVTFWASEYVPAAGENVGVAQVSTALPPSSYVTAIYLIPIEFVVAFTTKLTSPLRYVDKL